MRSRIIIACIILLTLSASIGHAGTWTEDFATGLNQWEIYNFQKGAEKWEVVDGAAIGEIFQIGFMSLLMIKQSENWSRYSIACKAKFSKVGEEVKQLPEIGLVLYSKKGEDTRYIVSLRSNGSGSIFKQTNGQGELVTFETKRYPLGLWIALRAEIQGNALIFSINNDVISGNDKVPLFIGQAGLMVANARGIFDDIVVSGDSIPNRQTSVLAIDNKGKMPIKWGSLKELYGR